MTDKTISAATLKHMADLKAAETRRRKLAIGIGSSVIVAALVVVGTVYALKPTKVTAASDKKQIAALVGSDKFATLPTAEKKELREALGDTREAFRNLDPEARRNLGESMMDERMEKYFALPPGKEREAELDKSIDEMQKRMAQWQSRAATRPATTRPAGDGDRGNRGGDRQDDPKTRAERSTRRDSANPAKRAERTEYFAAMKERAEARGIKMGGPGGGGGGPGGGGWGGGRGR